MKNWLFSKKNFYLFAASLALLVTGYVLLGQGPADNHLSKSVAPVILVLVYCGLIPYAMLSGYGKNNASEVKKK
ncbi:MAG: hypothetical protein LBI42_04365 [Chitinispirillales bacterium]|jgi:hypothetical protein|nr:hypothetical protein [Chitinispirillales bacterium]